MVSGSINDNDKMPLISIIVPIYNSEMYLDRCIASLINQTYKTLEILLVDDGSIDNSLNICKKYSRIDNRINIISQKNMGVSSARNAGIKISSGKFLLFVDSDDFLDELAIEKVYPYLNEYDLVTFGFNQVYKKYNKRVLYGKDLHNKKIIKNEIFSSNIIGGYLWNKVFRSDIIKCNNVLFDSNIHYCEDLIFLTHYLKYTNKVYYINESFYNYRIRKSSATSNFINKKNSSIIYAYQYLIDNIDDERIIDLYKYKYLLMYYQFRKFLKDDEKINYKIINNEKKILNANNLSLKEKFKFFLVKRCNLVFSILKKIKLKFSCEFD